MGSGDRVAHQVSRKFRLCKSNQKKLPNNDELRDDQEMRYAQSMSRIRLAQVGFGVIVALVGAVVVPSVATAAPPAAGETQLVSVSNTAPPVEGSRDSRNPSVSADGRYVAFESAATNLTASPTTTWQVYVRDTVTGATQLVSATGAGVAGNGDSQHPSISSDGSRIVYVSSALNLNPSGIQQAMLWTRGVGTSRVVSVSNGEPPSRANATVNDPVISGDGLTVAFSTSATNLTTDDTHGVIQVFRRILFSGITALVSVDRTIAGGHGASSDATSPSISELGEAIAFVSKARLTTTTPDLRGISQVYVAIDGEPEPTVVSVDASGVGVADANVTSPSVSPNGRVIAFVSAADNLTGDPTGGHRQIFVRSLSANTTKLGSFSDVGTGGANADCDDPSLSRYGDDLAFVSSATDLRPGTGNGGSQVFVRQLHSGRTVIASQTTAGVAGNGTSNNAVLSSSGASIALASNSTDLVPGASGVSSQVYVRNLDERPRVDRIDGADRFAVAAAVSKSTFAPHAPVAYVASGTVFPDALSGSAVAGAKGGPVLLVTKDSIPAVIGAELTRLQPARIVVLGGTATLSAAVETALGAYSPKVERISAPDRFQLSATISSTVYWFSGISDVVVASGSVFPDALAGSAAAGLLGAPVLLVTKDAVPAAVGSELQRLKPRTIHVLGGTDTISESVMTALKGIEPNTTRIAGADRYAVSAHISSSVFTDPKSSNTVYVASGVTFPDALSGSAAAIQSGSPVLLVSADSVPDSVKAELDRLKPTRIVILGGRNSVTDAVQRELEKHLSGP
ncbi:cell wall-binding repeat-containing protein [Herbiconiux sp. P16]|uniref:cell wall-binding repeat-containing protein n=1 Tax=Herbiconiux wuyangfengii TaxID=3342794 RepID=UPI0035B880FC